MDTSTGVNAVTIVFAALCVFAIAYRFYGLFIAQKVLNVNEARGTISLPSPLPAPCSDRCLPRSSATCRGCSGF